MIQSLLDFIVSCSFVLDFKPFFFFSQAAQRFMVLDDRRVVIARAQDEVLQKLQLEKEQLKDALKKKKKELDTASLLASRLNNQLKDAQKEVDGLRAKVELLEKANAELKTAKQKELDEVELRGYDFCFDEQVAASKASRGGCIKLGMTSVSTKPSSPLPVSCELLWQSQTTSNMRWPRWS